MKITVKWESTVNNRYGADGKIHHTFTDDNMRVIESDHPRFSIGTRFDYGFLGIASSEGYTIVILPKN